MDKKPTTLTEAEKKERNKVYQQRYLAKKAIKEHQIPIETVKEKQPTEDSMVPKALLENLQQSFKDKCRQYDELSIAYRNLQIKYIADSEAAKHFVKTSMLGLEILYPTRNNKGENN